MSQSRAGVMKHAVMNQVDEGDERSAKTRRIALVMRRTRARVKTDITALLDVFFASANADAWSL